MPKRVDSNQPEIVADLRKVGATVLLLHEVGHGCPDILVGFRGVNYLIEIKSSVFAVLNPVQLEWHNSLWRGQVAVVCTSEEALHIIGLLPPIILSFE